MTVVSERWPPVYDAEDLARTIQEMRERGDLEARFYMAPSAASGSYCQGDIFSFTSPVPLVDEDGQAIAEGEVATWMLLTNSCDFDRNLDDVTWAQMVPVDNLGKRSSISTTELGALRRYSQSRRFYVPPWAESTDPDICCADFTRPVTIHRSALAHGEIVARLSLHGWVLLHACLVRFLARDDGRYDVG